MLEIYEITKRIGEEPGESIEKILKKFNLSSNDIKKIVLELRYVGFEYVDGRWHDRVKEEIESTLKLGVKPHWMNRIPAPKNKYEKKNQ